MSFNHVIHRASRFSFTIALLAISFYSLTVGVNAYQLKITYSQALLSEIQGCDFIAYTIITAHAGIFPRDGFI